MLKTFLLLSSLLLFVTVKATDESVENSGAGPMPLLTAEEEDDEGFLLAVDEEEEDDEPIHERIDMITRWKEDEPRVSTTMEPKIETSTTANNSTAQEDVDAEEVGIFERVKRIFFDRLDIVVAVIACLAILIALLIYLCVSRSARARRRNNGVGKNDGGKRPAYVPADFDELIMIDQDVQEQQQQKQALLQSSERP